MQGLSVVPTLYGWYCDSFYVKHLAMRNVVLHVVLVMASILLDMTFVTLVTGHKNTIKNHPKSKLFY